MRNTISDMNAYNAGFNGANMTPKLEAHEHVAENENARMQTQPNHDRQGLTQSNIGSNIESEEHNLSLMTPNMSILTPHGQRGPGQTTGERMP